MRAAHRAGERHRASMARASAISDAVETLRVASPRAVRVSASGASEKHAETNIETSASTVFGCFFFSLKTRVGSCWASCAASSGCGVQRRRPLRHHTPPRVQSSSDSAPPGAAVGSTHAPWPPAPPSPPPPSAAPLVARARRRLRQGSRPVSAARASKPRAVAPLAARRRRRARAAAWSRRREDSSRARGGVPGRPEVRRQGLRGGDRSGRGHGRDRDAAPRHARSRAPDHHAEASSSFSASRQQQWTKGETSGNFIA